MACFSSAEAWASDGGRRRVGAVAVAQHRQGQGQGRQPLLGPVVQVPLDATPLAVPRLHDALAGRPDLLQLGPHLRVQPLVLDRHAGRGGGGADEPLVERRVVDQRRERAPVALHHRDRARLACPPRAGAAIPAARGRQPSASWPSRAYSSSSDGSPRARASDACSSPGGSGRSSSTTRSPTALRASRADSSPQTNMIGRLICSSALQLPNQVRKRISQREGRGEGPHQVHERDDADGHPERGQVTAFGRASPAGTAATPPERNSSARTSPARW